MYGWAGKILHFDLTRRKSWTEEFDRKLGEMFLGGRGVNSKLLWDLVRTPRIDPLDPENVLIFGTGTLTGTTAPSSGRTTITCKGPVTNLFLKTSMGGHWGAELKFAGYDHLIVYGKADAPVYISIQDKNVEIKDASHLWGLDVRATTDNLVDELDDREVKVACIGPAGENLVKFAAVMNSVYHAAARGGAGAVMGSKKMKAIAVRGTGEVTIADPERFHELAVSTRVSLSKDPEAIKLYKTGTAGGLEIMNEIGTLPCYNFKTGHVDDAYPLSGECLVEQGYLDRRVGCFSCTVSCHRYCTVKEGPYTGTYGGGPEYESSVSLGGGTGVFATDAIIKANELCNIMGLDTISCGSVIQWAMESFERGTLTKEDTDGMELTFGDSAVLIELIPMIAHRRGKIGNLLAEGVKRAAEKLGKDSWKWAICNSKGLEQSRVETRAAKAYALAFAVNPRGPDHLHTECLAEFGGTPTRIALIEKITGDKKWATPYSTEYRAEIVRWHEDCYAITDSMGFCAFSSTAAYAINPEVMAQFFSAATGIDMTEKSIMLIGRKIVTLEKCFNAREGADRKFDDLPWRLMHEAAPTGPAKGFMNSPEELSGMLDKYYTLHEWDLETSWPHRKTLEMLNLKDVAEELERLGKIPNKKET